MRQIISLGVDDLAATRFAVSPLAETVFALQLLRTGAADPVNRPWLRWARRDLSQRTLSLPLLWPLLRDGRRSRPEFLTPAPAGRAPARRGIGSGARHDLGPDSGEPGARVRSPGRRLVAGERGSAGDPTEPGPCADRPGAHLRAHPAHRPALGSDAFRPRHRHRLPGRHSGSRRRVGPVCPAAPGRTLGPRGGNGHQEPVGAVALPGRARARPAAWCSCRVCSSGRTPR